MKKKSLLAKTTLLIIFSSLAPLASSTTMRDVQKILKVESYDELSMKYGIENKLRLIIKDKYKEFKDNFEFSSKPITLKDGSIFFSGWKEGNKLYRNTAMVLISKDGRLYAAYYDPSTNKVNYYGPEGDQIPKAVNVWKSDLGPEFNFIEYKSEKNKVKKDKDKEMEKSFTTSQYDHYRDVMNSIWDGNVTRDIVMNDGVVYVIAAAEGEIYKCSRAIGFVPDPRFVAPYNFKNFIDFIDRYWKLVVDNNDTLKSGMRYKICIDAAAHNFKSELMLEATGL